MPVPASDGLVHVVDDDESLRRALGSLLRSVGLRVELHASPAEFLTAEHLDQTACVVMDVRLPGMSGLELQERMPRLRLRFPVILISGHGDIPMSVRGMKAGAIDFLTKPFRDQELLDAVEVALAQDRGRRAQEERVGGLRMRHELLTPREREVMEGVVSGKMNKQMAAELGLSEITVKIHRGQAMRKMEAKTFADLVRMAHALKPLEPDR